MSNELAQRAVACKPWRWLPGMRWITLREAPLADITGRIGDLTRRPVVEPWPGALPDLSDPCTRGGLLALVENTRGKTAPTLPHARQAYKAIRAWGLVSPQAAEALVAALEAAP